MLTDFYRLMPELYGETSCTHNSHLLSQYVRLWGPLWTHSTFGFESKNGHLKHIFHGKTDIVHQVLFNTDVSYTLQHVHSKLVEIESEQTIQYLDQFSHQVPRSNMSCVAPHLYAVGKIKAAIPTAEQSSALSYSGSIDVFLRLLKDRTLYYSTSYTTPAAANGIIVTVTVNCNSVRKSVPYLHSVLGKGSTTGTPLAGKFKNYVCRAREKESIQCGPSLENSLSENWDGPWLR